MTITGGESGIRCFGERPLSVHHYLGRSTAIIDDVELWLWREFFPSSAGWENGRVTYWPVFIESLGICEFVS